MTAEERKWRFQSRMAEAQKIRERILAKGLATEPCKDCGGSGLYRKDKVCGYCDGTGVIVVGKTDTIAKGSDGMYHPRGSRGCPR